MKKKSRVSQPTWLKCKNAQSSISLLWQKEIWQKKILLQQKLRDKHSEGIQIAKKSSSQCFFFQNCKWEFFAKSTFARVEKMALYLLRHCLMHNAKR